MSFVQLVSAILFIAVPVAIAADGKRAAPPPSVDPGRIVNESYGFLREREPTMTEGEYALYEKVVPMIAAQPEFALRLLEGMVAEEQSSAAFEFVLGNVYFEQRRYAEAEQRFARAVEKFPTFTRAWDNLGILHFTREAYAEAVPCFTKVLSLGHDEPRVLGLLAYCQLRSGNPLAAEASYLQAYSRDPHNSDWIEGLLSTYLESRQYSRAETLLLQLIRLKPGESRFWGLLATVLLEQGRRLEAIAQLEAGLSVEALDADGMLMLGDFHSEQKLYADALRLYERVAARQPVAGVERLLRYAQSLIADARYADARRVLAAAESHAQDEQRAAVWHVHASLHQRLGEWPDAVTLLQKVVDQEPMNGRALLDLGTAEEGLGNDSRAVIAYEAAARFDESTYAASLKLANLHVRALHFGDALAAIDRALALNRSPELLEFQARVRAMQPDDRANP